MITIKCINLFVGFTVGTVVGNRVGETVGLLNRGKFMISLCASHYI